MSTIGVIGGGASGFFSAISAKQHFPQSKVIIFERSSKFLAKVKISGGGRCNVANACFDNRILAAHYPRGENYLRKAFEQFNAQSTVDWFESRGVKLKTYSDNCIFPQSNNSQTIIDCFMQEVINKGIELKSNFHVKHIELKGEGFSISNDEETFYLDRLIVTTGGQPKSSGLKWLEHLGIAMIDPVPSLFTFNMPNDPIRELMGNVVEKTIVRVEGSKLTGRGPLLITHWGMSGPAILQLSAWGARELASRNYQFTILVNWLNEMKEEDLRIELSNALKKEPLKMLTTYNPFPITLRLWHFLLNRAAIPVELRWKDLSGKNLNRLINTLINDRYQVEGKTTFKEEFVTAGGISLKDIDFKTMQCRNKKGLFFAGELLDIDGITGGFNFQAAWTTGFIAGRHVGH